MSVIINPDKTISINGVKTFPIGIDAAGNVLFNATDPVTPENMAKYKDFTHSYVRGGSDTFYINNIIPAFEANGIHFFMVGYESPPANPAIKDNSLLLGYLNCDEPFRIATQKLYSASMTEAQCIATKRCNVPFEYRVGSGCWYPNEEPKVSTRYNNYLADPNHVSILNHWRDMMYWEKYSHIITWDTYTIGTGGWMTWTRGDSIYAYEIQSKNAFFLSNTINSTSKPVWAVIQANGADIVQSYTLLVPTPPEVRCNVYSAICMDVKGITFWTAHSGSPDIGLATNPTLLAYYAQIAREVRSINEALVSPTLAYKWYGDSLNPTTVAFNKNYTAIVLGKTAENWSYILKQGPNSIWLIVVNKDSRPIPDVTISISGLVGGSTATLRGLETMGSGASGRTIPVTNGQFLDSFDGQAVHIYEITSEVLPPAGSLSIISNPSGASIELGGVPRSEVTNVVLANIPVGTYELRLSLSGYYDYTEAVTINDNQVTYVTANLSLIPPPPPPPPIELSTSDGLIKITIAGIAVATLYSWVNSQFKKK